MSPIKSLWLGSDSIPALMERSSATNYLTFPNWMLWKCMSWCFRHGNKPVALACKPQEFPWGLSIPRVHQLHIIWEVVFFAWTKPLVWEGDVEWETWARLPSMVDSSVHRPLILAISLVMCHKYVSLKLFSRDSYFISYAPKLVSFLFQTFIGITIGYSPRISHDRSCLITGFLLLLLLSFTNHYYHYYYYHY